jgi:hypothetical protein
VRRTAFAHIIFGVVIGVLGILFLGPLAAAADWVGARLHNPDGVLALAAFSSIFKLADIAAFNPGSMNSPVIQRRPCSGTCRGRGPRMEIGTRVALGTL